MFFFFLYCLISVLVTVEFTIPPVWSTATPARNGFVMAVETHLAGNYSTVTYHLWSACLMTGITQATIIIHSG